eukprot:COSAG05_NODE_886_length_6751_cov_151.638906_9_plen_86_part_00
MDANPKLAGIDLTNLLVPAHTLRPEVPQYCQEKQDHELDAILDLKLIEQAAPALKVSHLEFTSKFDIMLRAHLKKLGFVVYNLVL